ncbi:BAG domain-containing protein [Hypoxylon sp. FL1284]|nr:BAG domain-containing protein [Hypoxylon sp. FL1284]
MHGSVSGITCIRSNEYPRTICLSVSAEHFAGCPLSDSLAFVKVASNQAILASVSAIKNITTLLPPALQTYVHATVSHLSDAVAGSNEYLSSQGVSPTVLYYTLAGAAVALPFSMMSRFGWSSSRDAISPYASQTDSQGVHVTDDDFSYITSEDLEQSLPPPSRAYDPQGRRAPPGAVDDDILLIKNNKGVTYPVHFPAYSIGDGKLHVQDVRNRAGLVMDLSERRIRRLKMLYKGRELKEQDIPIRDYGVKNNSELLVAVPEGKLSDEEEESSSEEVVVTGDTGEQKSRKKSSNKKNRKKKRDRVSPRESTANLGVPAQREREGRRLSPDPSIHPSRVPSPSVPSGPAARLEAIRSHFETQLQPLCQQLIDKPPRDKKKLEDEHRKLSETVMQHVLLKLDEVDTGGDPDIRARRKELVTLMQDVLKELDDVLPADIRPKAR